MKKPIAILIALFLMVVSGEVKAQFDYEDYDWKDSPTLSEVPEKYKEESVITAKNSQSREMIVGDEGIVIERYTLHRITKVNSEDAIEKENKIYYRSSDAEKVIIQKARVIKPNGEVVAITMDDLVVATDEASGETYRYFALEGLEVGSDIEYLLQVLRFPNTSGSITYFQGEAPQMNYSFELIYPIGLDYQWKTLNFDQKAKMDTSEYIVKMKYAFDEVEALKDEAYASYDPHRKAVAYKMMANEYTGQRDMVSFRKVSKIIYDNYMSERDKKDIKAVQKLIKKSEMEGEGDQEAQIHRFDRWMKRNIQTVNSGASELSDVPSIAKNMVASEVGLLKTYATAFAALDIEFEMVLTSDRFDITFDDEFENYSYLTDIFFYFPEHDKFLDPNDLGSAIGVIANNYTGCKALFVQELSAAGVKTGLGEVGEIPFLSMDQTKDIMDIEASIDLDNETVVLSVDKESHGYYAASYQPILPFLNEDSKDDIKELMVKWISEDIEIVRNEVTNIGDYDFGQKPLVQSFEVTCQDFLSLAGDKLLFKIGLVIGPQAELYSEEERTLPVDGGYLHQYDRDIVFQIPEGYVIDNLDDLKMNIQFGDRETGVGFVSDYTLDEASGKLTVHIDEWYGQVIFPVEEYSNYSAVINAAADFNKIVLVLRQK